MGKWALPAPGWAVLQFGGKPPLISFPSSNLDRRVDATHPTGSMHDGRLLLDLLGTRRS
jgi:hypothetical protein